MTEHLFDPGVAGYRVTIKLKVGGGPFDPAGYSVEIEGRDGELLAHLVVPRDARQDALAQLEFLGHLATRYSVEVLRHHRDGTPFPIEAPVE